MLFLVIVNQQGKEFQCSQGAAVEAECTLGEADNFGQRYTLDFVLQTPAGKAWVRSGRIVASWWRANDRFASWMLNRKRVDLYQPPSRLAARAAAMAASLKEIPLAFMRSVASAMEPTSRRKSSSAAANATRGLALTTAEGSQETRMKVCLTSQTPS